MLFLDLVETSRTVAATRSRLAKRTAIAETLRVADRRDVGLVVAYLSGAPPQRRTGLGWSSLRDLPEPAAGASLSVQEVDRALEAIAGLSGSGSARARGQAVLELFGRATKDEQRFLCALVLGELRQGAQDSVMLDAVAEAAGVPAPMVRRAAMLRGAAAPVAAAAFSGGAAALAAFRLEVGQPVRPMLATSAPDVEAAFARIGDTSPVSVDTKLDGIRIQVHRQGDSVRVFTRSLEEVTDRLPEVVGAIREVAEDPLILDGEALTVDADGHPLPFQQTSARTATHDAGTDPDATLRAYFFDCLHAGGRDLVDRPLDERLQVLDTALPSASQVERLVTDDADAAASFLSRQVAAGYEGVVVKDLTTAYTAGRRGSAWVKVKPRHTLDLVVLAVEWGSGRRTGWLSNIHLGARDPARDHLMTGGASGDPDETGWVPVGKTFKGMTDEMLAWQTGRFLELETHRTGHVVHVRPEQVVEVAFDGAQRSTRYRGGVALRFARVVRYRDDKGPNQADTITAVQQFLSAGSQPGE